MQKYIQAIHYGNEDISGGITKFWIRSSLKISAEEQIDFLLRLYRNGLPFSQRSMDITKKIMKLAETNEYIICGKTGSAIVPNEEGKTKSVLGWFVGWVERKDRNSVFIFAVNIEGEDGAFGMKAREIAEAALKVTGVL